MSAPAESDDYSFCSLVECYEKARQRNESPLVAAAAHVCHSLDAPLLARDPFQFALFLGVWLLYLYTRSAPTVVAVITVFYLLEFLVFAALHLTLRKTCAALRKRYSRTNARVSDPIVMLFSLFVIHGVLEFTIFGNSGAALLYTRQQIAQDSPGWRAALLSSMLLIVGVAPRKRLWAIASVSLAAFIVWLVDRTAGGGTARGDLAGWTFLRALALIALGSIAMLVPLGPHYIENSWFANTALLFLACSATFAFT